MEKLLIKNKVLLKVDLPLEVMVSSKRKFILNLNTFRNAHHMVLSKAKREYKELVKDLFNISIDKPVIFQYVHYAKTRRRIDAANPCSIIDKFVSDVIVDVGCMPDDNTEYLKGVFYTSGGVDKDNPRCELYITEV